MPGKGLSAPRSLDHGLWWELCCEASLLGAKVHLHTHHQTHHAQEMESALPAAVRVIWETTACRNEKDRTEALV